MANSENLNRYFSEKVLNTALFAKNCVHFLA